MENFFGKMKNEMFYGHEYEFTSLDAKQDIKPYNHSQFNCVQLIGFSCLS